MVLGIFTRRPAPQTTDAARRWWGNGGLVGRVGRVRFLLEASLSLNSHSNILGNLSSNRAKHCLALAADSLSQRLFENLIFLIPEVVCSLHTGVFGKHNVS